MRRFHFHLEPALVLRRRAEEQAQLSLAEAQRALAAVEARLRELRQDMGRHQEHVAELRRRAVDPRALMDAERYGEALTRAFLLQQERVLRARRETDAALRALQDRRVERESLERLKQRQQEEHRLEMLRREQQELDEASVLRWRRG